MNPTTNTTHELLAWQAETGQALPLALDAITWLEAQGHVVDLERGRVALFSADRPLHRLAWLPAPVALAAVNLLEALEGVHGLDALQGAAIGQALVAMRQAAYVLRQAAANATGENQATYQAAANALERAMDGLQEVRPWDA